MIVGTGAHPEPSAPLPSIQLMTRLDVRIVVRHDRRLAGGVIAHAGQRQGIRRPIAPGEACRPIDAVCDSPVLDERVDLGRV